MAFDVSSAATTLSNTANKVITDTGLASGLTAAGNALTSLKDSVKSGLSINISNITSAIPGASEIQSALDQARSNVNKLGNLFDNAAAAITQIASGLTGPVPNILHSYTSFNYIFTLSVMDDTQINFPNETYRKGMLGPLILKSGSGNPRDRVPTAYSTPANPAGTFDFYLEGLQINSSVGFEKSTGNTNATGFKFKIIEPYSMGLFFEVLQAAAKTAGHRNYLDMPLLLTVEFKGHIDADLQNVQIDRTTKYFPLRLRQLGVKVSGKGSEYDCDAYPVNEKAYTSTYSQLKTDVSISGKSVVEMLQTGEKSLQRVLNDRLAEAVKRKDVNVADQILISFPKDLKTGDFSNPFEDTGSPIGATIFPASAGADMDLFRKLKVTTSSINKTQVQEEGTVNDIGSSTMGFGLFNDGGTPFAKDNFAFDQATGTYNRGEMTINPSEGEFKFAQGSDVINAINQVILMSEYGRTALTQIGTDGSVKWWRVETQLYYIPSDANLAKTGVKPKLIVFRVVPYDVDSSVFLPPNTPKPGTEQAKKQVVKEYNFIYTGKNVDVIDWDIEFKNGFYTAMMADGGKNNGDTKITEQSSGAGQEGNVGSQTDPSGQAPKENSLPSSVIKDGVATSTAYKGGGGLDDAASLAARQFHDALTSGVDMINLNLTILGDPYYLADSGMGNYSAVATDNKHMTADGSMNYQNGEVHVLCNFRTPLDANTESGLYDFRSKNINQFSGLYKVVSVDSNFNRGKFTQVLKMLRLKGQEIASTTSAPVQLASTPGQPVADSSVQVFDDGSSIQTFDDGSTLVTDSEGNVTSTPAPGVELRTASEIQASADLAGFEG
jgi:hypothetical protein